ncbi:DNA/RNA nuclease SfsA [Vagococcus sp. BWB3-3]|uniref:Sugar fermentation stimulation protein homolog n=1 Tax=Vagococcus allomyrinae TaxID=2794353 RepID=A0A940PF33_9ENTE|nr:DNA/RNA nuclease SfsA [Vagococcus allomyrinae]MBP1043704.1 DNA/RNA nuclease SfsA [Vagococcus allomyrinae]
MKVTYPKVAVAQLIERKNRFIAHCYLPSEDREIVVHVKNTGRCRELFYPGVDVAVSYQASATRKTDYDLIAVKKGQNWINIDSQVPNLLAYEGIRGGQISLPGIVGEIATIRREVTFNRSRFDVYLETDQAEKVIVEVKGMTLENHQIGAFPDAPTERGLKHVRELIALGKEGYQVYVLFIVQMADIRLATIHQKMQPALATAMADHDSGLQILAYTCEVTPATIELKGAVPFDLSAEFSDPND